MNIVERAARVIDPGAFEEVTWVSAVDGKEIPLSDLEVARRDYHRAQAISKAVEVMKLASREPDLIGALVADEIERWALLGIPEQVLRSPQVRSTIRPKYSGSRM